MPEFERTASYSDYETEVCTPVCIDVEFTENFEVSVREFFDEMDSDDSTDMMDLLIKEGYAPSPAAYLNSLESDTVDELYDLFKSRLALGNEDDAVDYIYWPSNEQFINNLGVNGKRELFDCLNIQLGNPVVHVTPRDYWRRCSPGQRAELEIICAPAATTTALHEQVEQLIATEDNQFFGLPDELLAQLKQRLERRNLPELASQSSNPILREIVNALQPNQPIDPSLLNEMRLLAGSTSNAS